MTANTPKSPEEWPAEASFLARLTERPGETVSLAEFGGQRAVVRVLGAARAKLTNELDVLERLDHPLIPGILGRGVLGTGSVWFAREWIPGTSFDEWAQGASPKDLGKACVDLLRGLGAIHQCGVVHGDLSPGNIIVEPNGTARLTDFGMSSTGDGQGTRGGTPPFIAPEVLLGTAPTPASDLFGLGAVLALVLTRTRIDPAEFYGRFPKEPFLTSAGVGLEDLPEWSRSVLSRLVSLSPSERPSDALTVAHELEGRLGLRAPTAGTDPVLRAPAIHALAGRDGWVTEVAAMPSSILRAADAVEADDVSSSLALELARQGERCRFARCSELVLDAQTPLEIDRQVDRLLLVAPMDQGAGRSGRMRVVLLADSSDPWSLTLLDSAKRAVAASSGDTSILVIGEPEAIIALRRNGSPWEETAVSAIPPFRRDAVAAELQRVLRSPDKASAAVLDEFVDRVDQLAAGSSGRVAECLERAAAEGAFERTPDGLRLSPSFVPARLAARPRHATSNRKIEPGAARLLTVLDWAGRPLGLPTLRAAVSGLLASGAVPSTVESLIKGGLVVRRVDGRLGPTGSVDIGAHLQDAAERREVHRAFLRHADALEIPAEMRWGHELASDPEAAPSVDAQVTVFRAAGLNTRAARGLAHARILLEREGLPLPQVLQRPLVMSFAESGDERAAIRHARALQRADLEALAKAMTASLKGNRRGSAAAYEQAGAHRHALAERAHLAFEMGDSDALAAELDSARRGAPRAQPDSRLGPQEAGAGPADFEQASLAADLTGLAALEATRAGDPASGLALIDGALNDGPPRLVEAALLVNRATVARSGGDVEASIAALQAARAIYQNLGLTSGIARTLSLLGGALRESGNWLGAEEALVGSLTRRVRLADPAALATTRASLGLVRLERGRMRAAQEDLAWASARLTQLGILGPIARIGASLEVIEKVLAGAELDDADRRSLGAACRAKLEEARGAILAGSTPGTLLALSSESARAGADGIAARLAMAALAAEGEGALEASARIALQRRTRTLLAQLEEGLTPLECSGLHSRLLFSVEPAPEDLRRWDTTSEDDMDVLTVLRLNERLVAKESSRTLLAEIVQVGLEVTGAERGFLVMAQAGELMLDTAFLSSSGDVSDEVIDWSHSVTLRALRTGKPVRIADAIDDVDWGEMRSIESIGIRSILAVPFTVSDTTSGVIVVDDRNRAGSFGPREERMLELLASQAALAIRQMDRLEEIQALTKELRGRVASQGTELQAARRALTEASSPAPIEGLVGDSKPMQRVRDLIHRVAAAEISVLISGPSGAGKEVAARAIHRLSGRSSSPFVSENCAAIPASLVESELFGSVKGSYTGADQDRPGLFERANGGTLFLDEIGELPPEAQAKLLRVLETRRVRRVGDTDERPVDFRLLSATNRDLDADVADGTFRADLLFRLDGVRVVMPSLAERPEDIAPLVRHLLDIESAARGEKIEMSSAVMQRLESRSWGGNVRELANEIRRLAVLSEGAIVDPDLLRADRSPATAGAGPPTIRTIAQLEKQAIMDALELTDGDKRRVAELLGISRAKVYQRLKEWDVE